MKTALPQVKKISKKEFLDINGEPKENPIRQEMNEETGKMTVYIGHGKTIKESAADGEKRYINKLENKYEPVLRERDKFMSPELYDMINKYRLSEIMTADKLQQVLTGWSIGLNDSEVAQMTSVSPSAISAMCRDNPVMNELRAVLRSKPRAMAKKNVYNKLQNDPTGEYSLKYLEKAVPEEFGGKGAVINITNDNRSVTVEDKMAKITELLESIG